MDTTAVEIVNAETGEMLTGNSLPAAFLTPKIEGLRLLNQPRDYRALVSKDRGVFECNGVDKGRAIKMRILNYRVEHGVRFGSAYPEPETVVQVIFADEQNLISTIVFRTSSMDGFLRMVDNAVADQVALATLVVTAEMDKTTTKANHTFYITRFKYESNSKENVKEIIEFVNKLPEALYCYRSLPKEGAQSA